MMFGKTHEDANLKLSNKYSQRQWLAWFPVREVDGRWIWLETITKKWSAACGGDWRYYANPKEYKRNKTMKEFEKWYNKTICPYIHNPKDKEIVKCGWRVALEWALMEYTKNNRNANSDISFYDIIKEELEATK